jgi:hypothetical protein|tara:strand:- start:158 stop:493 length:336 start_codon:yes stop_codon:yes gene_type:complete
MNDSIDAQGLAIFLAQLVFISLIIERAVAQVKALVKNGIEKPWPAVATAISGAIVFGSQLPLIPVITGITLAWWIDGSILTLWLAGGASGIINTVKDFQSKRQELHQVKLK